jgi:hypothetical protein
MDSSSKSTKSTSASSLPAKIRICNPSGVEWVIKAFDEQQSAAWVQAITQNCSAVRRHSLHENSVWGKQAKQAMGGVLLRVRHPLEPAPRMMGCVEQM